jgi:RNA polymerase sigma-70 factor (ECF subfamily)
MSDNQQHPDPELLAEIATNPADLEQFYRRHVEGVTRFLSRRCRTPEDVADAVSATFVAVLFSAHSFDPELGSPMAWLYSIARNEAHGQGRSLGRREALRLRLRGSTLLSRDDADRIAEIIDAERQVGELDEALGTASTGELELLRSMAIGDLTVTQASSSLGISAATGRKRLERLRRRVTTTDESTICPTPEVEQ